MVQDQKGIEVSLQKLIHRGRALDNAKTLGDYTIGDGESMILMVSKVKQCLISQLPTATLLAPQAVTGTFLLMCRMDVENPQQAQPIQPAQPQQPSQPMSQPIQAQPAQPSQPAQPQQGGSNLPFGMTEDQLDDRINELISITGADREQAITALRAAFFDVNMAANYVFEGIPANAGQHQAPHGGQAGAGGAGFDDGAEGELANNPEAQAAMAELHQLVSNPAFQQLRAQARANPQIIPTILEHLRTSSPNVHQILSSNPELLAMLLLGEGAGAGAQGGQRSQGSEGSRRGENVIELTREEMDAIERVNYCYLSS